VGLDYLNILCGRRQPPDPDALHSANLNKSATSHRGQQVLLEPEPGATYPVWLKGRRACPPEDVGGIWGYAEFLQILADPDHPEYEERLEWIGGEFDPEEFDVEDVNAALASLAI
jgi:hypothetical protein